MATEAPSEKLAKGCFFVAVTVAVAVIALFLIARHTATQRHDNEKDRAHAQSVALARTFAGDLTEAKGASMSARAAAAAAHHKEIAVRAVNGKAVTISIGMHYGISAFGGSDLTTCFRVVPPATDPAEVRCPKGPA